MHEGYNLIRRRAINWPTREALLEEIYILPADLFWERRNIIVDQAVYNVHIRLDFRPGDLPRKYLIWL